jgi:formate dehydrogenase major subunit
MDITRRTFLKVSGITMGVMLCPPFLKDSKAKSYAGKLKTKEGTETTTICPYCACGCGIVVTASGGKVVNTEGDPDHPINEGTLCSKGNSLYQTANQIRPSDVSDDEPGYRNEKVLWRKPGASDWTEIPWGLAMFMMAAKIKRTRRQGFVETENGITVNRCESIAAIGGAALDNEECYLYTKLARSLGIVYFEHQARI